MTRGKNKGNSFERLIAKSLSKWWTSGERDDIFWRSVTSGGWATSRHQQKIESSGGQEGDLQALDPIGQPLLDLLTIEIKRGYPKASLSQVLEGTGRINELLQMYKQARRDSRKANKPFWILISKRDRQRPLIHFPMALKRALESHSHSFPSILPQTTLKVKGFEAIFTCRFDSFLHEVDPSLFQGLQKSFPSMQTKKGLKK